MIKRWHVVSGAEDRSDPDEKYWTVSLDPREPGWQTDGGCKGYGLTKALAEELANAANLVLTVGIMQSKKPLPPWAQELADDLKRG